ncbi:response regulator transcription factor [Crassaminicella profunda]|uniref:response regulator transcription factor n=1 Tax=Crassaminicella profunda TaxID=1286698 RepID=UPI001CA6DED8|nr:response regulator transcription factor [Crassaminicella profunda]QZY54112.1 response regulator transcription factor [Crassaminicella profunda]
MKKKILIVEDDLAIAKLIEINLNIANYETKKVMDGLKALEIIDEENFDLIILDVMLPQADGFEVMEKIKHRNIPVIFLTAKKSVFDKVNGLKLGAEDYMVKPFEAIELLARIEVVLRRYGKNEKVLNFKDIKVYLEERIVKNDGNTVELSPKEYELLCLLIQNKNIALSREQILGRVWDMSYYGGTRTVDMHIKALRQKLDLGNHIKTIYKIGYRLED